MPVVRPVVASIPDQIAQIVDEEIALARANITARIGELFGLRAPLPAAVPVARLQPVVGAPGAKRSPTSGKRYRASPEELESLQDKVMALFKAKGDEVRPRDVQKSLGGIDRHRVSHALRALAVAKRLKLVGERGGARYVRLK